MATPIPKNEAPFTLDEVLAATGGRIIAKREIQFKGVTTDSRAISSGSIFVALKGESFDGHNYVAQAIGAGAALVIVEAGRASALSDTPPASVVEVADTLDALGDLARAHLRRWRSQSTHARVIAITGSAGKTTTKEMCAALVRQVAPTLATAGNLNNRIGVPSMALCMDPSHVYAVFELGMSLVGEMKKLAAIVEPEISLITMIGIAHAEGAGGSKAAVAREKGAIFEALHENGTAIVNADDPECVDQSTRARDAKKVTFGRHSPASYQLVERQWIDAHGTRLVVTRPTGGPLEVLVPPASEVAALDFVSAIAAVEAAIARPVQADDVARAATLGFQVKGRGEIARAPLGTLVIDDSYNANPSSMRASLQLLSELSKQEKRRPVAILGEMLELGDRARQEHEDLGLLLAEAGVALAIGCGGLIERTIERAAARGIAAKNCANAEEAAQFAKTVVEPNDVVLVKGSRAARTELVARALIDDPSSTRGASGGKREPTPTH